MTPPLRPLQDLWQPPTMRQARLAEQAARDQREEARLDRLARRPTDPTAVPAPRAGPDFDEIEEPDVDLHAPVRCTGVLSRKCNRIVPPDMMTDIRTFPVEIRGTSTHCCDGCLETLYREERIDRITALGLMGAPAEWLDRYAEKLVKDRDRKGLPVALLHRQALEMDAERIVRLQQIADDAAARAQTVSPQRE